MASDYEFKRLRRMMKVYWVVQGILIALLVFMAVSFQAQFRAMGHAPGVHEQHPGQSL